jgi:nucleoside-diphosphate-sugar epimerase
MAARGCVSAALLAPRPPRRSGRSRARRARAASAAERGDPVAPSGDARPRVLVLGGSGFVGSAITERALARGYAVTSVSRRGAPPDASEGALRAVDWRVGDAADPAVARDILAEPGFVGCVHAVGMLLASDLNALASGSGSKPAKGATYDVVTRVTAFNAADAAAALLPPRGSAREGAAVGPPPFVFVSAAEARWDFRAPVDWLEDYLVAKRAVEAKLGECNARGALRASWLRPSLVYTTDKPAALPAVAAFTLANAIGIPFVDKPVTVDVLAAAAVRALEDGATSGALDYREMERLAKES